MVRRALTNVVLTSAVAGTQTVSVTPLNSSGTPGTAVTKTITWVASTTLDASAAKSTSVIRPYVANAGADFTTDGTIVAAKGTTPAQVAAVKVVLNDTNGVAKVGQTLSVSVSGSGLVAINQANETVSASSAARAAALVLTSSQNSAYVGVFNDGTAGTSTITISAGTTVIATETVTFTGSAAKYEVTSISGTQAIGVNGGDDSATATGVSVYVTDSAGNAVGGHTVYLVSADTTIATVEASATTSSVVTGPTGYAYFDVTGIKSGSTTVKACDTSACTAATVTASAAIMLLRQKQRQSQRHSISLHTLQARR